MLNELNLKKFTKKVSKSKKVLKEDSSLGDGASSKV